MLISAVQQCDSVLYINCVIQLYIYNCDLVIYFIFFSIMVYYRILVIVTCAIQWDLVYFIYSSLYLLIPV